MPQNRRSGIDRGHSKLHIPPVLPTHFKHRIGQLPKRAILARLHQHREHILIFDCCVLQKFIELAHQRMSTLFRLR
jgi:hypothetical protein